MMTDLLIAAAALVAVGSIAALAYRPHRVLRARRDEWVSQRLLRARIEQLETENARLRALLDCYRPSSRVPAPTHRDRERLDLLVDEYTDGHAGDTAIEKMLAVNWPQPGETLFGLPVVVNPDLDVTGDLKLGPLSYPRRGN